MTFRSLAGTRDLFAVAKTLRKLYPPQHEPCAAIDQALEALAFLEAHRRKARVGRTPKRKLASVA